MSKERELLKKCAEQLNSTLNGTTSMRLAVEIEALLAQPEQEPSSDDYMYNQLKEDYDDLVESSLKDFQRGFASALNLSVNVDIPNRKPLSDEVHGVDGFAVDKEVLVLIRAVEKAHGIGV